MAKEERGRWNCRKKPPDVYYRDDRENERNEGKRKRKTETERILFKRVQLSSVFQRGTNRRMFIAINCSYVEREREGGKKREERINCFRLLVYRSVGITNRGKNRVNCTYVHTHPHARVNPRSRLVKSRLDPIAFITPETLWNFH